MKKQYILSLAVDTALTSNWHLGPIKTIFIHFYKTVRSNTEIFCCSKWKGQRSIYWKGGTLPGVESGIFLLVHKLLFFSFITFFFICPICLTKWKHLNIGFRFATFFSCAIYLLRVSIEYFWLNQVDKSDTCKLMIIMSVCLRWQGNGESCITRSWMICTPYPILYGR
jgi:hypothetical protein